ncbi:MAG: thioredoxin family protein [Turicibacter sp.]|nr:thioredoxin family protein [Turicibacter sp.]
MEKVTQSLTSVSYEELKEIWQQKSLVITLTYTPICGTCQVAKKMLEVIQTTLPNLNVFIINLNYYEKMAIDYEIMSVPCLLIHKNEACIERVYTFESVPFIYKKITSYF